ncbi:hypothetical protein AAFC00_000683 [Neodothiora populina]|uniref:PPM-type phosphatase domain-containing protein n=1 Tax=Neodothiora populina TaxID=2781224 RepID=A0ABR3PDN5_9PEZI
MRPSSCVCRASKYRRRSQLHTYPCQNPQQRQSTRQFHDYFVAHLPSSSLHPDSGNPSAPPQINHHKLPREDSAPFDGQPNRTPIKIPPVGPTVGVARDTTVVRIPLKSAKHHFGIGVARGSRPYNEDTHQAGTIEVPAFAKRQPISLTRRGGPAAQEHQVAERASGDPQVFYYGVFDGHGGTECSEFLRDRLHGYVEDAVDAFGVHSTLDNSHKGTKEEQEQQQQQQQQQQDEGQEAAKDKDKNDTPAQADIGDLQRRLVNAWRDVVGGYFKRFRPEYFTELLHNTSARSRVSSRLSPNEKNKPANSIEAALTYAFLHADLDFTSAQSVKHTPSNSSTDHDDPVISDRPINETDILSHPSRPASQNLTNMLSAPIGGTVRFQGGSTASIALISTPTQTPYWHPASPATIITAHCGDTRILLCRVDDGRAVAMTTDHHPSSPIEATRLRRYAATFITDSFGQERVLGLANSRAFGDIGSKHIGVSAEPEIRTVDMRASEYSFLVLVSDGVSGTLEDQEIVDVVKEARTPAQASQDLVSLSTGIGGGQADNATALVVRLGGWERRNEGGVGSLGTREQRQFKKSMADDPRSSRQYE